jgi:hypothetical protein
MDIQKLALASKVMEQGLIESIYKIAHLMSHEKAIEELRRVCVSHERLRSEYLGLQIIKTSDVPDLSKMGVQMVSELSADVLSERKQDQ